MIFTKTKHRCITAILCGVLLFEGTLGVFAQPVPETNAAVTIPPQLTGQLPFVPYWSDIQKENELILQAETQYQGSSNKKEDGSIQLLSKTEQIVNRVETEILRIAKNGKSFVEQKKEIENLLKEIYNETYDPDSTEPNNSKGIINSAEEIIYNKWLQTPGLDRDKLQKAYTYYVGQARAFLLYLESGKIPNFETIKERLATIVSSITANALKPLVTDTLLPTSTAGNTQELVPEYTLLGRDIQVLMTSKKSQLTGKSYQDWVWDNPDDVDLGLNILDMMSDFKNVAGIRYKLILQKFSTKKQAQVDYATKLHKEVSDVAGTISSSPYDMQTIMQVFRDKLNAIVFLAEVTNTTENGFDGWSNGADGIIEPLNIPGVRTTLDGLITTTSNLVDTYKNKYEIYPNFSNETTYNAWVAARNSISTTRDSILAKVVQLLNKASMFLSDVKSKIDQLDNTLKTEKETQTGLSTIWGEMNTTLIAMVSWSMGIFSRSLNIGIEQISKNAYLKQIHGFARDLANMFFVLFLVIVGLMTAFEVNKKYYTVNKIIPRFIQSVILVNFSILLCQIITDFSLVLTNVILEKAGQISAIGSAFSTTGTNIYGLSGAAPMLLFGDILTSPQLQVAGGVFDNQLASVIILFVILVMTIAVDVFLIIRAAAVWLLVALSPVIILLWFIPDLKGVVKIWWSNLIRFVFMGPLVAMVFLVGVSLSQVSLSDSFLKIIIGLATFGLILTVPGWVSMLGQHMQTLGDSVSPKLQGYMNTLSQAILRGNEKKTETDQNTQEAPSSETAIAHLHLVQENSAEINMQAVWKKTQERVKAWSLAGEESHNVAMVAEREKQEKPLDRLVAVFKKTLAKEPNSSFKEDTAQRDLGAVEKAVTVAEKSDKPEEKTQKQEQQVTNVVKIPEEVQQLSEPARNLHKALQEDTAPFPSEQEVKTLLALPEKEAETIFKSSTRDVKQKILAGLLQSEFAENPFITSEQQDSIKMLAGEDTVAQVIPIGPDAVREKSDEHPHTIQEIRTEIATGQAVPLQSLQSVILEQTPLHDLSASEVASLYKNSDAEARSFILSTLQSPLRNDVWSGEQTEQLTRMAGEERIQQASEDAKHAIVQQIADKSLSWDAVPAPLIRSVVSTMSSSDQDAIIGSLNQATNNQFGVSAQRSANEDVVIEALGEQVIAGLPKLSPEATSEILTSLPIPEGGTVGDMVPILAKLSPQQQEQLVTLTHSNNATGQALFTPEEQHDLAKFAGNTVVESGNTPVLALPEERIWNAMVHDQPVDLQTRDVLGMYFDEQHPQNRQVLLGLATEDNSSVMTDATQDKVDKVFDRFVMEEGKSVLDAVKQSTIPDTVKAYDSGSLMGVARGENSLNNERLMQNMLNDIPLTTMQKEALQQITKQANAEQQEILLGAATHEQLFTPEQKQVLIDGVKEKMIDDAQQVTSHYQAAADTAGQILSSGSLSQSLEQQLVAQAESPFTRQETVTALQDPEVLSVVQNTSEDTESLQGKEYDIVSAVAHLMEHSMKSNPTNSISQEFSKVIINDTSGGEGFGRGDRLSSATNETISGQAVEISGDGKISPQMMDEQRDRDPMVAETPYEKKIEKAQFIAPKNILSNLVNKKMIMK